MSSFTVPEMLLQLGVAPEASESADWKWLLAALR